MDPAELAAKLGAAAAAFHSNLHTGRPGVYIDNARVPYTAQVLLVLLSDTIGDFGDLGDVGDVLAVSRLGSPLNNVCPQILR